MGVELPISRIEAKFKLSQNRSDADVDGVIAGLAATGHSEVATDMRAVKRPTRP